MFLHCQIKVEKNCVGDDHQEDKLESQLLRKDGQGSFKVSIAPRNYSFKHSGRIAVELHYVVTL